MSTAAPNGKTTQVATGGRAGSSGSVDKTAGSVDKSGASVDKKGGSIDKPSKSSIDKGGAKPKSKTMTPEQRRQAWIVGIAAVVVLVVSGGIYAYFHRPSEYINGEIRLDATPERKAEFVASDHFDKLAFDRQALWLKEMANQKKEMEELWKSGKISAQQLSDGLAVASVGKQIKHMEKYFSMGEIAKKDYLDKILDDQALPDDPNDKTPKKNKAKIKSIEERFPQDYRTVYDSFEHALRDRKKDRDREAKKIRQEAKTTTRPATRPGDRPMSATQPANTAKPTGRP